MQTLIAAYTSVLKDLLWLVTGIIIVALVGGVAQARSDVDCPITHLSDGVEDALGRLTC